MIAATKVPCAECGHVNPHDDYACALCGHVLRPWEPEAGPAALPIVHRRRPPLCEPLKTTLGYLLAGALLAPVFTFTPVLQYMGWFLGSLVHETGHCVAAWAAGCPSLPVISLRGHAMATHGGQSTFLCLVLWGILAYFAWQRRREPLGLWILAPAALVYPLVAFTGLREVVFLLGGHLGELAFAGIFLWRAVVGGFTDSRAERVAHATVACFLLGRNIWLAGGLLLDEQVRAWYRASGSFGLTNDYLRLANDVLRVDLGVVAFFMLAATLAVLPLVWMLSRPRRAGF